MHKLFSNTVKKLQLNVLTSNIQQTKPNYFSFIYCICTSDVRLFFQIFARILFLKLRFYLLFQEYFLNLRTNILEKIILFFLEMRKYSDKKTYS